MPSFLAFLFYFLVFLQLVMLALSDVVILGPSYNSIHTIHLECYIVRLAACELTETCWETVASALEAENSVLSVLDLSDNYRVEKGAMLVSDRLRSSHCKLEILRSALLLPSGPKVTMRDLFIKMKLKLSVMFIAFLSFFYGNEAHFEPHDSRVILDLTGHFILTLITVLRLARCHFSQSSCAELASALTSISSSLSELDLSNNDLQDTGLELLFVQPEYLYCKLHILRQVLINNDEKSFNYWT